MALLSKKQASCCSTGCTVAKWIVCVLLFLVSVMAWCKKMSCCMSGSCEVCK